MQKDFWTKPSQTAYYVNIVLVCVIIALIMTLGAVIAS
jgi:hypothetical protein